MSVQVDQPDLAEVYDEAQTPLKVYPRRELERMKRPELDAVADQLGVPEPKKYKTKLLILNMIMDIQGTSLPSADVLNEQEKEFCRTFMTDRETIGNGVQSYIDAFNVDFTVKGAFQAAKSAAHRLLNKPAIIRKMNEYLEEFALNDQFVDREFAFLLAQKADLRVKFSAVKMYKEIQNGTFGNGTVNLTQNNFFNFTDERAEKLKNAHEQFILEQTKSGAIDVSEA